MISLTTDNFWDCYYHLPKDIQRKADNAYALWMIKPHAKSLNFKKVIDRKAVYSVRIDRGYRALGQMIDDVVLWFWIGSHDEYVRLLKEN